MPAMWDNLKSAQVPPPQLKKRPFLRSQTQPLQQREPSSGGRESNDSNGQNTDYWQANFENRLNGLGIHNTPLRYEIRRGKTVPQPDISTQRQLSPPLNSDDKAPTLSHHHPPPRNPRRLHPDDDAPWRPASSVYDNASSHHRRKSSALSRQKAPASSRDMYGRPTSTEISPPSSPELDVDRDGPHAEDVSPIDEGPDMSQQDMIRGARPAPSQVYDQRKSHIPTMRRDRPSDTSYANPLREHRSQDRLGDQQGRPVAHPWEANPKQAKGPEYGFTAVVTGPQAQRTGNAPSSFGQRMRQFARGKPESVESRPPWSGASGRSPLIDPVRDDPSVAPLDIGRKGSKRVGHRTGASPETPNGAAATVRRLLPSRSNQKLKDIPKTPESQISHTTAPHAYPSPPYATSPPFHPHAPAPAQPTRSAHSPSLLGADALPGQQKAIKRKPSPTTHTPSRDSHASFTSLVYSALSDQTITPKASNLPTAEPTSLSTPVDRWVQPSSRFSVTTCNTTVPESPRHSAEENRPPLPTPPTPFSSVMDRRRPIPGSESPKPDFGEPIVISIKSAMISNPDGVDGEKSALRTSGDRPLSVLTTTDKELPPAPPELQSANDRVANLNAKLEGLAHQRININRSIRQMTELMPTDNLMASTDVLRKREIEKKKVEGLKEELAEIQRKEHDLGLKLYRANKRLEREGNFESSTLWVRRVTN